MLIIDAGTVHRVLDFPSLIAALRDMFRDGCEAPLRHHHAVPGGTLLLMPAWREGRALGVKIVSVFPGNADRGLPAVYGTYLLLDPETGAPLATIDGTALTLRRTAAASALAADYLARQDASVHLMVGTGALAPHLIAAHAAARPIRRTLVWGRDPSKAARLAAELGDGAEMVENLERAVGSADIVSCATLAREPLIRGAWLRPGTHVDLVGGFTPDMREADDETIRRARVYIDTDTAIAEAGDIAQPLQSGALTRERIAGDLSSLCRGEARRPQDPSEITLFKSVGTAIEDLAAARLVFSRSA